MLVIYKREADGPIRETEDIESGEWIRLEAPTQMEIARVSKELGLDESLLKDVLDPYEAPRFEIDEKIPYIFLRYPFSKDPPGTAPILIVVTKDEVATVARGTPSFLEDFASGEIDFLTTARTRFVILIITEITRRYTTSMTSIQRAVNRRKQNINEMSERDIVELASHESAVNTFLDALIPQSNALAKLAAGKTLIVEEADRELLDDVILSTTQLIELGRSLLKTMENTREAYTAISTQRLNAVIRRLTALTVLVTIPNVVTGFYGMNVLLPAQDNPAIAGTILLATLTVVVLLAVFLIWRKWI